MTTINVNGNTYSDDGSTPKDMNQGGYRTWIFPMIQDVMTYIAAALSTLSGYASAAAASAASAINAPGTSALSTTSLTTAFATQTFVVQTGKSFVRGQWVTLASAAAPTTVQMSGPIGSYDSATGAMTADIKALQALGATAADWTVSLSAPGGAALGFNKYTGSQFYAAGIFEGYADLGAGSNVDLSTGTMFSKTVTGNLALTVSGVPAGSGASFVLRLVNGGAFTFTPPAGTKFAGKVAPSLTVSGTDRIGFVMEPGGTWEMYVLGKDVG